MDNNLHDIERPIADFLKTGAAETVPETSLDDDGTPAYRGDALVMQEKSLTQLYELLALMHVPLREIIDPDERDEYRRYLAARAQSRSSEYR